MKKILNRPEEFVDEMVEGILYAYPDKIMPLNGDKRVILNKTKKDNKVGIVTAGGSGHLPVFLGYVGDGMLDGCAVGNVFASPSANKMYEMIKACNFGKGVLCLYGNYGGDKLNFEMAMSMAEMDGIQVKEIRVMDDIASSPIEAKDKRRGVAGMVFAYKVAGAAAQKGYDLEKLVSVTEKALDNIRTMGIALSPCIVPEVGKPTFSIKDDEMEIGMGIHGEVGIEVSKLKTSAEVAKMIFDKIATEISFSKNDEVAVMINGLGATPLEELFIIYRDLFNILNGLGVKVISPHVGEFATSMEMAGLSITIMKLDDELKTLLLHDANTPFYTNANKK
ncbi:dihydroxyacetone kinase subunit DhaK [Treponema denticola]|jgi:dihydroxyacetone kinase family protein|uniref:dihydroxyacetone kinase subunit DhaK n=1 Tax=Treponema denticola TaxID=158 RepID=UPI0020A35569|nr:dihydroxyacetone kinase subunit DhaK [Treponema denticola]UTC84529.1 dihydroxyacetone kinase subunit DhaK [Treponema denticola]UTC87018.1 dihydroxyacetone kinase subunit DhaK [Treponema denticola]